MFREEEGMKTLDDVVKLLQKSLELVRKRAHGQLNITLLEAEIELDVIEKGELKAGLKFEVVPIDVGVNYKTESTHRLSLKLAATQAYGDLGSSDESEDLADSIIALAGDVSHVKSSIGTDFTLSNFSISLEFKVSKEGKLQVVAGGSKAREGGHTIKLTFRPGPR
jgi:hypothetical protein